MTSEPVTGYPEHWEADVILRDGRICHIRPIRPEDQEALAAFHESLSPETVYYRFFAPYPRLTEKDLLRFTNVDYVDRVALVAEIAGEIIGVGRYDRIDRVEAEIAFVISDEHQGRGLGSILLEHLAVAARERAITRFEAEVLPSNRRMLATFEEAGYKVPETMEDLKALTEKIVADGGTPWCIGLGSGGATGWPATDWVEDMMLRTQSPETYDQWVTNEIPFNDPKVVGAIEEFGWFARNDKFVDGGAAAVATTDFRDSPKGLFASPPKCYMHRQASFIPSFFPEGTKLGVDADFFYFPAYAGKDLGTPVLGAGTLVSIAKDTPAARAFIEWLETPIAHEVWMAQSGFLTPYKGVNPEAYANDQLRKQGEILTSATTFRFDGSDLMPGKIGAGAFWTGMVDYAGGKSAEEVATGIQKEWDSIK